ncbi:MAG: hypothetical protein GWN64_04830, partial [Candidatus Thorarchaeota archaeon]|nr:hypothetical protein [Candidatus Thorarchaeota archaeon]
IGAAIPGAGALVGQAKRLLPATEGSVVNKLVSKVTPQRLQGAKPEDIEEVLSNPEL